MQWVLMQHGELYVHDLGPWSYRIGVKVHLFVASHRRKSSKEHVLEGGGRRVGGEVGESMSSLLSKFQKGACPTPKK